MDKDYTFYESILSIKVPGSPREGSEYKESHIGCICPLRNGTQLLKQVPWPCLMSMQQRPEGENGNHEVHQ